MKHRILVTGDRAWKNEALMMSVLGGISGIYGDEVVLIEGCADGADAMAERLAQMLYGWEVPHFPAEWERYGNSAGAVRNQAMLDAGPDEVLAFHKSLKLSKGTLDMVDRALRARVPVRLFPER